MCGQYVWTNCRNPTRSKTDTALAVVVIEYHSGRLSDFPLICDCATVQCTDNHRVPALRRQERLELEVTK